MQWLVSFFGAVFAFMVWLWRPLNGTRAKFRKQAHIIKTSKLNEGDVYRSLDVKDGPLLSEPFPGVTTLHEIFMYSFPSSFFFPLFFLPLLIVSFEGVG